MVCVVVVLIGTSLAAAELSPPQQVVSKLNDALAGVLKDAEKLGYQGRFDRLAPALDAAFDRSFMAHQALGRQWDTLSAADQARWQQVFSTMATANYASRFDHWAGQTFTILGEEAGANDTVMVRTKVTDPGHEDVELTYRMRETPAGWKVIDIYLKGTVSEIALRRSEYAVVLKRDGFEALVASLNGKIAELAAGGAKPVP